MLRPQTSIWADTFDPNREFVVRRPIVCGGTTYRPGQPFPKDRVTTRTLRALFYKRDLGYGPDALRPKDRVMTPDPGPEKAPENGQGAPQGVVTPEKATGQPPPPESAPTGRPAPIPADVIITAKHMGVGKWSVLVGGEQVASGLTRAAAEAHGRALRGNA